MISGSEIKVLDRNAEYYGVLSHNLMENAGKGVADFIIKHLDSADENILVFCGMGNNGGDGFVTQCNFIFDWKGKRYKNGHFKKKFL